MSEQRECVVCHSPRSRWAEATVLGDVPVRYSRCSSCGLVQAEDVDWFDRAYSSAIANADVGLLDRCVVLSHLTSAFLHAAGLASGTFLDWAGGYGALTRLMRDRGFDFRDHDPMAENLFAGPFRLEELGSERYDAITAFEVLEHLADPIEELRDVATRTDCLLMTTQVLPSPAPKPGEWDYYALDAGQHITFYTPDSLRALADELGFTDVVPGALCHVFHRGQVPRRATALTRIHQAGFLVGVGAWVRDRKRSLTVSDAARWRD